MEILFLKQRAPLCLFGFLGPRSKAKGSGMRRAKRAVSESSKTNIKDFCKRRKDKAQEMERTEEQILNCETGKGPESAPEKGR
jgi:hypothetical protein